MAHTLELMRLDTLKEAPRNPKDHDDDAQRSSVGAFGFIEPIVLDERTGCIVSGHGRRAELMRRMSEGAEPPVGIEQDKAGHWLVPVVRNAFTSTDDLHAEAAGVALNRVGERGGWKADTLADVLTTLADAGRLEGTGFDADTLDDVLATLGNNELPTLPTDAAYADRPERLTPDAPRDQQGLREVGLMFNLEDHREFTDLLARLKRQWSLDVLPLVVLRAMRVAVEQ